MADNRYSTSESLSALREDNTPVIIRLGKAIMASGRTALENEALKTAYEKTTKGISQVTLESNKEERKRYEEYVKLIGSHVKGLPSDSRNPIRALYEEVRDDVARDAELGKLPPKEIQFALRTLRRVMEEGGIADKPKKSAMEKTRKLFSPHPPLSLPPSPKRSSSSTMLSSVEDRDDNNAITEK